MQLLEQERARYALDCIDAVKGERAVAAKYKIYVRGLAAMVQINGLGQALARIGSDLNSPEAGPAAKRLLIDLGTWLIDRRRVYQPPATNRGPRQPDDLLRALMAGDRSAYLRAYEETIELCNWLKKLADAFIG